MNKGKLNTYLNYIIVTALISAQAILQNINLTLKKFTLLADTSIITIIFYGMLFLFTIIFIYISRKKNRVIFRKGFLIMILLFVIFFFNYVLFKNTRSFYVNTEMMIIYIIAIPIAVLIIPTIYNYERLFSFLRKVAFVILPWSLLGLLFFDYDIYINYMSFSYAILPLTIIVFYLYLRNSSYLHFSIFLAGLFSIFFFGSRMVFLSILLFIIFIIITRSFFMEKKYNADKILKNSFLLIILLVAAFILTKSNIFADISDTRIGYYISNDNLFDDANRKYIYELIIRYIIDNNFKYNGLFADRIILYQSTGDLSYSHNIFLELSLSFGFIGVFVSFLFVGFVAYKYIKYRIDQKLILLVLLFSFFTRYLVSGSFVEEPLFYLFISLFINLGKRKVT